MIVTIRIIRKSGCIHIYIHTIFVDTDNDTCKLTYGN